MEIKTINLNTVNLYLRVTRTEEFLSNNMGQITLSNESSLVVMCVSVNVSYTQQSEWAMRVSTLYDSSKHCRTLSAMHDR